MYNTKFSTEFTYVFKSWISYFISTYGYPIFFISSCAGYPQTHNFTTDFEFLHFYSKSFNSLSSKKGGFKLLVFSSDSKYSSSYSRSLVCSNPMRDISNPVSGCPQYFSGTIILFGFIYKSYCCFMWKHLLWSGYIYFPIIIWTNSALMNLLFIISW